ncbi:MAG TPA: MEDS domain-containing protein [Thermoanaerobaculia bacterium]
MRTARGRSPKRSRTRCGRHWQVVDSVAFALGDEAERSPRRKNRRQGSPHRRFFSKAGRLVSHMEWALQGARADGANPLGRAAAARWTVRQGRDARQPSTADSRRLGDLAEFEASVNDVLPRYDYVVICVYDLSRFPATTIIDVIRSHQRALV